MNVDKASFLAEIRQEMKYIGMKGNELSSKAKIPKTRFVCLMNNKAAFKDDEIENIKNILGLN